MPNTDRIGFNTLERLLSSDMMDAQAMISRAVADLLGQTFSQKLVSPGTSVAARNSLVGLDLVTDGGNNALLNPGALLQYSTTYPAAVGALESPFRLGFNRAPLAITLPTSGALQGWLLEGRVVDVVTSSQTRDVFNPVPQTFTPTLVPKQTERKIQTQWIGPGASGVWPGPSGDPWVPLFVYVVNGAASPLNLNLLIDIRPQVMDGSDSVVWAADSDDGTWLDATLATYRSPSDGATTKLKNMVGSFRGCISGSHMSFHCKPITTGFDPLVENGFTNTNAIVHLYLCPLRSVLGKLVPRGQSVSGNNVTKIAGTLVVSLTPPTVGKSNSIALDLSNSYLVNWNGGIVPIGDALYIGSVMNTAGGTFYAMSQSSGGDCYIAGGDGISVFSSTVTDGVGHAVLGMDLRPHVPPFAKSVYLAVQRGCSAGATPKFIIQPPGGAFPRAYISGPADSTGTATDMVRVSAGGARATNSELNMEVDVRTGVAASVINLIATVYGWEI